VKHLFIMIVASVALAPCTAGAFDFGKVVEKSLKRADRRAEQKVGSRIDKGINKAMDAPEKALSKNRAERTVSASGYEAEYVGAQTENHLEWSRFDFVPGTQVLFEDTQAGERNGEFPSRWDLAKGTIENATLNGENVILFDKCNTNSGGCIVPLVKNSAVDYLPEEFTIEFDAYFEDPRHGTYKIFLVDTKNQRTLERTIPAVRKWLRFNYNSADYEADPTRKYYPGTSADTTTAPGWRHFSISFNQRALKAYIDDARVLNIPNLGYNPTGISLGYHNPGAKTKGYVKNVRIAQEAVPLYDKVMTDGKFVTTGIRFDVNRAAIRPESQGIINEVVTLMRSNPWLNFRVEGHTDSDGDEASNLKLSQARAQAVVNRMVEMGIAPTRLTARGWGESRPATDNATPEGKANNRRVEFVRF